MTKQDAFSGLKLTDQTASPGFDQRLFGTPPAQPAAVPTPETTKQRTNETTLSRDNEAAIPAALEAAPQRPHVPAPPRSHVPGESRSSARADARTQVTVVQRSTPRTLERHSHDIYHDQVRWLNRVKLEFEERYGAKVTGNVMVQLALDLLRDNFEAEGERSNLVRVLVFGRPRHGAKHTDQPNGEDTP